jgi:hypothetical protein
MKIEKLNDAFGRDARNVISKAHDKSIQGALACLETFYFSFNNKDIETFRKVWLDHELIQLNNPLGGIMRGIKPINELYKKIFTGEATVWVEFSDIVLYHSNNTATFAGREKGEFSLNGQTIDLQIRTTRFLTFSEDEKQWFQIHHHGSIDNADLLKRYQDALK